ncbi:MAG: choice-of-anchor B family protein [Phycisphaerales bacterium JB039]
MTSGKIARVGFAGAAATVAGMVLIAGAHEEDWRKLAEALPPYQGPIVTLHDVRAGTVPIDMMFDSENMTMLSWVPLSEFAGGHRSGNDIWGYTSPSGREYAIMGLEAGYGFVEITDPTAPVVLDVISGPASTWHDVKVIGEYAYGVSEAGSGIQVMDLSQIDSGIVRHVIDKTQAGHRSTHNIVSNPDSGYLYLVGGNIASGGLVAVDTTNPEDPTIVGQWSSFYVHDAQVVSYDSGPYAGREIAFCLGGLSSGWSSTGLRIVDVTDKSNMFTITEVFWTAAGYAHQGWLSEDRKYFYVDDELDEEQGKVPVTTTRIFNVEDISNPSFVGTFTSGMPSTDHNLYVKGNRIYEANYTSGVRVFDNTDPENPVQIAWFDTHPETDASGYNGMWGVYPFFESGTIICSDRSRGLFVLEVDSDSTCRVDLTGDGLLDIFDFLEFQNLFGAGDLTADFTGDGVLDFFDFLAFQNEFALGCP